MSSFMCVCVAVVEFDKLYQILGVTIQERGESFYNKLMPEMVQELERKSEGHTRTHTHTHTHTPPLLLFCTSCP